VYLRTLAKFLDKDPQVDPEKRMKIRLMVTDGLAYGDIRVVEAAVGACRHFRDDPSLVASLRAIAAKDATGLSPAAKRLVKKAREVLEGSNED